MEIALPDDIAGTKVYLVGPTSDSLGTLAMSLRKYRIDAQVFADTGSALSCSPPHVVVYVKTDRSQGLDLLQRHFHTARFLVIGTSENRQDWQGILERGVHGWVMYWEPIETMVSAVLLVCRGGSSLSLSVLEMLQRRAEQSGSLVPSLDMRPALTGRQTQVLQLISRGYPDTEIADLLTLSVRTVHRHVQDVLQKLNVHSREAASQVFSEPTS